MLRRFSAFLLSFFFCLTLLVPSALADDGFTSSGGSDFDNNYGVRWSGFVGDGSRTGVLAKAPDMWSAAVYACGGNPGLLSAEVRSKLSDPNYGGRFYAYAQSFGHIMSVSEIPGWVPLYILAAEGITNVWHGDFGDMLLWSSEVPNSLISGAMIDYRRVLAGEDLGGGGSGGTSIVVGDYFEVGLRSWDNNGSVINSFNITATNATIDSDGVLTVGTGTRTVSAYPSSPNYVSNARIYLSHSVAEFVNNLISQGYKVAFDESGVIVAASDLTVVYGVHPMPNGPRASIYYYYSPSGSILTYSSEHSIFYYDGMLFCFANSVSGILDYPSSSWVVVRYFCDPISTPFPTPPSGDWPGPSSPSVPSAPDLPGPAEPTVTPEPTVTTPTPTWPDVNITVNPPAVVAPVTPDGLDYTELLTRINDNLNSINSYVVAVNSSLNSLRSDLVTEFASVVQSLRNIYGYLQHMDSVLEVHCVHIRNKIEESAVFIANYMRSLVYWLAEQLDYDDTYGTDSYDDSLLTTINEKLGGGTYEPNPIKDELGYYEWLDDLWDRFLLGDDWQSSASSISASFGQLKTRFPFSIPWDIVALFRLFVHEPVTPVFDLPLFFSGSSSTPVRVDLTPWDGVASVVRPLIYVIFALKLALLSRDLLAGLGADKGGLS